MLDLDGDIVGERGVLSVKCFDNSCGVPRSVEEIRISKGNVLGAGRYLLPDIFHHDVARDHAKRSVIHGNNRAVPAQMPAAAAGLCVADKLFLARSQQLAVST